jgi:hypothetical protein
LPLLAAQDDAGRADAGDAVQAAPRGPRSRKRASDDVTVQLKADIDPEGLLALWNSLRGTLPKALALSPDRRKEAQARIRELPQRAQWELVFTAIAKSRGCNGCNKSGWRASFDYAIKKGTWVRALEGTLDWSTAQTAQETKQEIARINGSRVAEDLADAITAWNS